MERITRRAFLRDLGQGTLAVAVIGFGVAACSSDEGSGETTSSAEGSGSNEVAPTTSSSSTAPGGDELSWERVNLGGVSAYLLIRRGEVAVVDTGYPGDAGDIEASLAGLGLGWADVSHVILTHLHGDHIGSLGDVMAASPAAAGFAGEPDIPGIPAPRPLTPVWDGDTVFGLEIIGVPGHTPGSIAIYDPAGGVLVAGDAMNGSEGGVVGANPRFTEDMVQADASIRKLAGLDFEAVVFGHGEPVLSDASGAVGRLAAGLGG